MTPGLFQLGVERAHQQDKDGECGGSIGNRPENQECADECDEDLRHGCVPVPAAASFTFLIGWRAPTTSRSAVPGPASHGAWVIPVPWRGTVCSPDRKVGTSSD
jgi:hypothetical protein